MKEKREWKKETWNRETDSDSEMENAKQRVTDGMSGYVVCMTWSRSVVVLVCGTS